MAEEGKKDEGQGNSTEGQSNDSAKSLTSMHISTYEEAKYDSSASGVAREGGWVSTGWAKAVSKDERAQKSQAHTRIQARNSPTPRQRTRQDWMARQDWQRMVQGVRRQYWYTPPSQPREPYAKGSVRPSLLERFLRLLGLE